MTQNTSSKASYPLRVIPGYFASKPGIQIGTCLGTGASEEEIQFLHQLGIEWIMLLVEGKEAHTAKNYIRLREKFESRGLKIYRLANHRMHNYGAFEGFKRALEIADSPNIGVCLCVGCWLEGGAENMGADVIQAIRYFGSQKKLFKVHFRNVSQPMPAPWSETLLDDGYMDMHRVMQALREVDYDGAIIPDHVPAMIGGGRVGLAYSIGYMRALVQAVNNQHERAKSSAAGD